MCIWLGLIEMENTETINSKLYTHISSDSDNIYTIYLAAFFNVKFLNMKFFSAHEN